jgi:hypothetical protein
MITTFHYYIIIFITSYYLGLQWVVMKPLRPITDPPNLEMQGTTSPPPKRHPAIPSPFPAPFMIKLRPHPTQNLALR